MGDNSYLRPGDQVTTDENDPILYSNEIVLGCETGFLFQSSRGGMHFFLHKRNYLHFWLIMSKARILGELNKGCPQTVEKFQFILQHKEGGQLKGVRICYVRSCLRSCRMGRRGVSCNSHIQKTD